VTKKVTSTRARKKLTTDQRARIYDLILIGIMAGLGAVAAEIRGGNDALQ